MSACGARGGWGSWAAENISCQHEDNALRARDRDERQTNGREGAAKRTRGTVRCAGSEREPREDTHPQSLHMCTQRIVIYTSQVCALRIVQPQQQRYYCCCRCRYYSHVVVAAAFIFSNTIRQFQSKRLRKTCCDRYLGTLSHPVCACVRVPEYKQCAHCSRVFVYVRFEFGNVVAAAVAAAASAVCFGVSVALPTHIFQYVHTFTKKEKSRMEKNTTAKESERMRRMCESARDARKREHRMKLTHDTMF